MFKKVLIIAMTVVLCLALCASTALAVDAGAQRVTIGADLTEGEVAQIYSDFGITRGSVTELTVTNSEERQYLEGLGADDKIGNVALSCTYLTTLNSGEGINVSTHNINWCTEEMYRNALVTAGITDASVMVSAPKNVSGTAALTGIYKAYEDITGIKLVEAAKEAGTAELVITGELAEYFGTSDATELVAQLKGLLDQTQGMTDDEVRAEIRNIAENMNLEVTDEQVEKLLSLCRSLEGLDVEELQSRLESMQNAYNGADKVKDTLSNFGEKVTSFFGKIGDFFSNLFGGNK